MTMIISASSHSNCPAYLPTERSCDLIRISLAFELGVLIPCGPERGPLSAEMQAGAGCGCFLGKKFRFKSTSTVKSIKVPGDALPLRLETSSVDVCASESPVVKSAEISFLGQEILRLKCKYST